MWDNEATGETPGLLGGVGIRWVCALTIFRDLERNPVGDKAVRGDGTGDIQYPVWYLQVVSSTARARGVCDVVGVSRRDLTSMNLSWILSSR